MTTDPRPAFSCLSDTNLTLADPNEDIRGRRVVDDDGNEIGTVDDLGVDAESRRVRFLLVATGALRALSAQTLLVPVSAVDGVGDEIRVGRLLTDVTPAAYDPELIVTAGGENLHPNNRVPPIYGPGHMHPPPVRSPRRARGRDND